MYKQLENLQKRVVSVAVMHKNEQNVDTVVMFS